MPRKAGRRARAKTQTARKPTANTTQRKGGAIPVGRAKRKAVDEQKDTGKKSKRDDTFLGTTAYIPPKNEWPVNIQAPMQWKANTSRISYGIYVDDDHCIVGDDNGEVVDFNLSGKAQRRFQLPEGVKCVTRDGEFIYAGCNDGGLYDLTHGEPRLMSMVESFKSVYWIDVRDGIICASDVEGKLALVNYEGEVIWKRSAKGNSGWMARIDGNSVYHGHSKGVDVYAISDGRKIWSRKLEDIMFGVQNKDFIFAAAGDGIHKLDKKTGKTIKVYDSSGCPSNEVGDGLVFATGSGENSIICHDEKTGKVVYMLKIPTSLPMSMHYHNMRLYCVGSETQVIDLSADAIKKAKAGKPNKPKVMTVGDDVEVIQPMKTLETVTEATAGDGGVLVECIKEGSKLRIHPVSAGYNSDWNCQFPRDIRRAGARYWVEKLIKAPGKFYRTYGTIKEIRG